MFCHLSRCQIVSTTLLSGLDACCCCACSFYLLFTFLFILLLKRVYVEVSTRDQGCNVDLLCQLGPESLN